MQMSSVGREEYVWRCRTWTCWQMFIGYGLISGGGLHPQLPREGMLEADPNIR
jgi:hypothetical protein